MPTSLSNDLPNGWVWTTVKLSIETISLGNKKLKKRNYETGGKFPVIDQGMSFIGGYTDNEELKLECELPVVVFGDHTKTTKYVNFDFVAGADGIKVIKPEKFYHPRLFYYFIRAISLPDKGYARHFQFLEKAHIPVPPLSEQYRILDKLDILFSQLDAAVDSLKEAHVQLQRYRRSILKAAFEGELTREWRAGKSGELEPMSVSGDSTSNSLPELPDGWVWTTLANCADILDSRRIPINAKERKTRIIDKPESELYPYYGATGQVGWIDDYLFDEELVLLGEDGAPFLDFLKDTAYLIKGKSWVNNHAHVLRAKTEVTSNQFLCHYLNTFDYHGYLTGTTRLKLNQSAMRKILVPIPSFTEQKQIVSELQRNLSGADEIEITIAVEIKRAERLRQSILRHAFSGKLVPQDPNDEPASVLLEKIRKEKKHQQPKKRKKNTTQIKIASSTEQLSLPLD